MAFTLTEASKLSTSQLQRGVIETVADSTFFNELPFIPVEGNAFSYVRGNALGGADFRGINEAYAESTPTFTNETATLAILGGDADVDRFLIKTQSGQIADLRAAATASKAKAVRLKFMDCFINGDGTNDTFEGIEEAITSGQEVTTGEAGMGFGSTSDSRQSFFDKLDELISKVQGGPSALIMNSGVLAKLKSAARRESVYDESRDDFGRQVSSYAGIPLIDAGYNDAGNAVIAQNENYGTPDEDVYPVTNASSIYAVRFNALDGVAGITNGGIQAYDLGEINDKPVYRTRIEFYCGVVVMNPTSVAALRGVLVS
jgi:hypothetical protein